MFEQKSLIIRQGLSRIVVVFLATALVGCPTAPNGGGEAPPDNASDNMSDPGNNGGVGETPDNEFGLPFNQLTGTELLVEGTDFTADDGSTRQRKEQFTSNFTLTVISGETSQAFVGDAVVDVISGDLQGQAQLTYTESGSDFDAGLIDCATISYEGEVEWQADISGSYQYIPSLDQLQVTIPGADLSSPQYTVTFTAASCPELDSLSFSSYYWGGPGVGTWGGVPIVLEGGRQTSRLENPFADDLGEEDFYEIQIQTGP